MHITACQLINWSHWCWKCLPNTDAMDNIMQSTCTIRPARKWGARHSSYISTCIKLLIFNKPNVCSRWFFFQLMLLSVMLKRQQMPHRVWKHCYRKNQMKEIRPKASSHPDNCCLNPLNSCTCSAWIQPSSFFLLILTGSRGRAGWAQNRFWRGKWGSGTGSSLSASARQIEPSQERLNGGKTVSHSVRPGGEKRRETEKSHALITKHLHYNCIQHRNKDVGSYSQCVLGISSSFTSDYFLSPSNTVKKKKKNLC